MWILWAISYGFMRIILYVCTRQSSGKVLMFLKILLLIFFRGFCYIVVDFFDIIFFNWGFFCGDLWASFFASFVFLANISIHGYRGSEGYEGGGMIVWGWLFFLEWWDDLWALIVFNYAYFFGMRWYIVRFFHMVFGVFFWTITPLFSYLVWKCCCQWCTSCVCNRTWNIRYKECPMWWRRFVIALVSIHHWFLVVVWVHLFELIWSWRLLFGTIRGGGHFKGFLCTTCGGGAFV